LLTASTMKVELACSSETSAEFQRTTRSYIAEDRNLHSYRCENLKSNHVHMCRQKTKGVSYFCLSTRMEELPTAKTGEERIADVGNQTQEPCSQGTGNYHIPGSWKVGHMSVASRTTVLHPSRLTASPTLCQCRHVPHSTQPDC
jgi:hypothetical protein